jgi:hypothetical protein
VGGCLTGEHGVGIEKRDLMTQFNAADLAMQMAVKDVFDRKWLLNPAKVFPLATTEAIAPRRIAPPPKGKRTRRCRQSEAAGEEDAFAHLRRRYAPGPSAQP